MFDTGTPVKIFEGDWEEIASHIEEIRHSKHLRLTVFSDAKADEDEEEGDNLFNASPEEQEEALDEIDALNKGRPVPPLESFCRENHYG